MPWPCSYICDTIIEHVLSLLLQEGHVDVCGESGVAVVGDELLPEPEELEGEVDGAGGRQGAEHGLEDIGLHK